MDIGGHLKMAKWTEGTTMPQALIDILEETCYSEDEESSESESIFKEYVNGWLDSDSTTDSDLYSK